VSYGLSQDDSTQNVAFDAPGGIVGGAVAGSFSGTTPTVCTPSVENSASKITPACYNIWAGYADRQALSAVSYTGVRATWKVPANAATNVGTLVWVGLGSALDVNTGCDTGSGRVVDSNFTSQSRGYCLTQAGTATYGANIDKSFTQPFEFW